MFHSKFAIVVFAIFFTSSLSYSQYPTNKSTQTEILSKYIITDNQYYLQTEVVPHGLTGNSIRNPVIYDSLHNSYIRWFKMEPYAVGYGLGTNASGLNHIVGWFLNDTRISFHGNQDTTPLWEYPTILHPYFNYVSISDSGNLIGAGLYKDFYVFHSNSPMPFFDFDVTTISTTLRAKFAELTSDGKFLIGVANRMQGSPNDTSFIMCFSTTDQQMKWKTGIYNSEEPEFGVQGIRLSGNDSLMIISTFYHFYVLNTYSGNIIYSGKVGPNSTSNTQETQSINGDGTLIGTTSHDGYLTVYQKTANGYSLLWQHHGDPYQWITVSDFSYDGNYIACGTMDQTYYYGQTVFNGQVKLFKISEGPVPHWKYLNMGDMVTSVSFSKNGNILSACSWGDDFDSVNDLVVFKTSLNSNAPIFKLIAPGSLLNCKTSKNGNTVIATGKRVHARVLGNGGTLYNIEIDSNDVPIGISSSGQSIPSKYQLFQNYPNPFNPTTKIRFDITGHLARQTFLSVYDMLGNEVALLVNEELKPGTYEVEFNGSNYSSGVYFYKLTAETFTATKKMVLIK